MNPSPYRRGSFSGWGCRGVIHYGYPPSWTREPESLLQSTVQPGDTVELRGEFTKPIKLQVSRVTLRPADLNAPPTIKSTIRLAQPEQKVLGLKVVPGASAAAIEVAAPGCEVGWCEITGFAARGIVIGKTGTGAHVHHNWVHDQAALTGAAVAGIIAGTGRGTSATPIQALIESNRLEKLKAFQAIEFKSSRNKARGNTVIGAEIVMRHGNDNRTEGNWVKDGLIGLCGERPVSAFDHVFGQTASRGPSGSRSGRAPSTPAHRRRVSTSRPVTQSSATPAATSSMAGSRATASAGRSHRSTAAPPAIPAR